MEINLDKMNHIGYTPARNGCGGRVSSRCSPPLDGRCSLAASAAPPKDIGSGSLSAPASGSGASPHGMTARTRARTVAPRCRRAERTVSHDPRPSFASQSRSHARMVRATNAPAVARCFFPGVFPRSPAGGGACQQFGSHEDTKMSDAPQAPSIIASSRLAAAKNLGTASPLARHLRGFV